MSRRSFVGGLIGSGGLLALGCTPDQRASPTTATGRATTTAAPTTTTTTTAAPATTARPTTIVTSPSTTSTTSTAVAGSDGYVPSSSTWETVAPADAGWDAARLDDALAFAEARSTRAILLLDDGRIVAERYVGVEPSFRREVASCQKSVVSVLVGIAQQRGLLTIDDAVGRHLGPGWTNAAAEDEAQITIRHLLSMTSGLDAERRLVAPPGTVWSYGNDAYHQLQPVLEAVAGQGIDAISTEWLWDPIGAADSTWAQRGGDGRYARDAKGVPLWGLTMSARDMARFGLLVQRGAVWGCCPVLDDTGYLQASLTASSEANPSYGYLWWLNGAASHRIGPAGPSRPGPLVPGAPDDLVAALGKDDQKIYVGRAERLVLVRQGGRAGARSTESLSDFDGELWRRVLDARAG